MFLRMGKPGGEGMSSRLFRPSSSVASSWGSTNKKYNSKKKMECASLVCVQVPSTNSVSCPVTGSFGSCIGYSDEMLCLSENVCVRQTGVQAMSD